MRTEMIDRKTGRPAGDQAAKRRNGCTVWMTDEEYRIITERAEKSGDSLSRFFVNSVLKGKK